MKELEDSAKKEKKKAAKAEKEKKKMGKQTESSLQTLEGEVAKLTSALEASKAAEKKHLDVIESLKKDAEAQGSGELRLDLERRPKES